MTSLRTFKVRPSSARTTEAFRVKISAAALLALKLRPGGLCYINYTHEAQERTTSAIAWTSNDRLGDAVAQISDTLKNISGLSYGDQITISKAEGSIEEVTKVTLRHTAVNSPSIDQETRSIWEGRLASVLPSTYEIIGVGQHIRIMPSPASETEREPQNEFTVLDVGMPAAGIAKVSTGCKISVVTGSPTETSSLILDSSDLGGIETQARRVQAVLSGLNTSKDGFLPLWMGYTQGLMIYGPKGTGKSVLIAAVEKCSWSKVFRWFPGSPAPKVTQFPTLIMVQGLEGTAASSSERDMKYVNAIGEFFEAIRGKQVLLVAEVRHPNNVNEVLRGPSRFEEEVELPVPNAVQRGDILRAIRAGAQTPNDSLLTQLATTTHGYVGADLLALLRIAGRHALERRASARHLTNGVPQLEKSSTPPAGEVDSYAHLAEQDHQSLPAFELTTDDMAYAQINCRPSALQTIIFETPNVRWSDIGGQHEIKKRLQNAVERPLKMADRMQQLNLRPKKGVLLYGPPGCSKTLLVKALAREAGLNFLTVKGAELISMYVGESERAIREIFRKARAVSPSIIFFDEIDSIAANRRSELNVLTTLLNEMDGFDELRNVFVVAATNKPQSIDPALLRPGRLDDVVYIGLPDFETRREILQNWFSCSRVVGADVVELAGILTEGFSGAEIVGVCQTAGNYAMDEDRDHISYADLKKATKNTPRGVTRDMLEEYAMWQATRG